MSTPTVNISRNDSGGWAITHDGHDLAWALLAQPAMTLSLDIDEPTLTAALAVEDIEIDTVALVLRLPDHVRDALLAAGWTEPKEGDR